VKTGRSGAASKAGHDLVIHVTSWQGTLTVGEDPAQTSIELDADASSLRVHEGKGGAKALGENDKADIQKTIDGDVLKGSAIKFRSTEVSGAEDGSRLSVRGELELAGKGQPVDFELSVADGQLTGSAVIKQTDWGIKPYSALFGALKVKDEVEVEVEGSLPSG
jgi:polyisoprenoid-binding protein YceI